MRLELRRCALRSWREGDEPSLVHHANSRRVWLNLRDNFPSPYTLVDAQEWVCLAAATTPVTNFAIEVDGAAVGGLGFVIQSDVYRRSAEVGYWLGEEYWGRGIASEALAAATEYAFERFDLCRIYAGVFEWNQASMRVLEKAGYELEGRLRKAVIKDGRVLDQLLYAIVR